jgi:hypothetical protein
VQAGLLSLLAYVSTQGSMELACARRTARAMRYEKLAHPFVLNLGGFLSEPMAALA